MREWMLMDLCRLVGEVLLLLRLLCSGTPPQLRSAPATASATHHRTSEHTESRRHGRNSMRGHNDSRVLGTRAGDTRERGDESDLSGVGDRIGANRRSMSRGGVRRLRCSLSSSVRIFPLPGPALLRSLTPISVARLHHSCQPS